MKSTARRLLDYLSIDWKWWGTFDYQMSPRKAQGSRCTLLFNGGGAVNQMYKPTREVSLLRSG